MLCNNFLKTNTHNIYFKHILTIVTKLFYVLNHQYIRTFHREDIKLKQRLLFEDVLNASLNETFPSFLLFEDIQYADE